MVSIAARKGPALPSKGIVKDYDVVLIVGKPLGSLVGWDTICRESNVNFFAAVSRGTQAFFFSDLGEHSFQLPVSDFPTHTNHALFVFSFPRWTGGQ